MSWELEYTSTAACPCGKGTLVEETYGDDWNRRKNIRFISCQTCNQKYHFESKYYLHKTEYVESVYLIENGKTISVPVTINNFNEDIEHHYYYVELQKVIEQLKTISASKMACGTIAEYAVRAHKHRYKSVKLCLVQEHTTEAVEQYYSYTYNKENMQILEDECRKVDRYLVAFSR